MLKFNYLIYIYFYVMKDFAENVAGILICRLCEINHVEGASF